MPPPPDSPHADPAPRKRRRKRDDPQSYFNNSEEYESDEGSPVSCSDVESFQGKIVYNPDGSAYIIDSENDSLSNISETGLAAGVPTANNPKIHSFRVVTARDATINKISEPNKIQKPILMCFICKLSFGNTKSFSLHANSEHTLNLHESEKLLLNREYSSAIIQRNADEKPQISFLEPLDVHKQLFQQHQQQFQNSSTITSSSTPLAPSECVSTTNATANTPSSSCTPASSAATNNLCSMLLSSSGINSQMLDSTVATVTAPSSSSLSSSTLSTSQTSSTTPQASVTTTPVSSLTLNNSNKLNSDISTSGTLINSNTICSSSNIAGQNLSDFVQQQLKQQHQQSLMRVSTPSPTQTPSLGLTSCSPTSAGLSNTSNNNNDSSNIHSNSQQISPKQTPSSTSNVSSFLSSTVTTSVGETSGVTSAGDLSTNNNSNNNSSSNNNSTKLLNEFLQQQQQILQQQQSSSQHLSCPEHQGFKISGLVDCKSCELINITNLKSSPMTPTKSPNSINLTTTSSSASLTSISPTTPAPSFTIGACPDHINGRPIGVDCARCEMILSSARLNSGSQISTRNSCKTLKCPQCNWHYKYQETLEIHMREKHPDGESACGYCLAGQQHPRLARGESYTCGYKPYRCEICNYSTTTKGNLSIHMQSDKHLNNMQELNNSQNLSSSNDIRENPKIVMPNMPQQTSKPKPSFRCDVCSYETSVARNLRIHMTSEKHTHNMAVLQNNMKHFQALSFLQSQNLGAAAAVNIPNLSNMSSLQQNMPNLQNFLPEAALADLAYNQALMIQLLHQNSAAGALGAAAAAAAAAAALPQSQPQQQQQQPQSISQQLSSSSGCSSTSNQLNVPTSGSSSSSATSSNAAAVAAAALLGSSIEPDQGLNLETMEPPIEPDQRPTTVFSCLICSAYNTNSIEELNNHLMIDRSRNTGSAASNCNSDIMLIINNNYICRLCNYKTNLKANFQLHSKTDKHIQKLNYINHIKEGGPKNEYKLKYNNSNTVQLKCNCCDFYTNSIQKLNLHSQHMRHDTMKMIFNHLVYIDQMYSIQLHRRASTSTPTTSCVNSQQSSSDPNQRLNATSGNSDIDHQQQIGTSTGGSSILETSERSGGGSSAGGGSIVGKQSQQQQLQQQQLTHSMVCELCSYKAGTVLQMIQHVKSIRHVQVEQFICLQRRSENLEPLELSDVFKIIENGIIKSEKCSPVNSPVDANLGATLDQLGSGQTSTPIPRLSENIGGVSSSGLLQTPSSLPMSSSMATIMKCSNCDFFCETKQEIEMHLESMHPNSGTNEYLTIPANSMALHAFQAAVAAATAAAEANKSSSSPLAGNAGLVTSITPNSLDEIKSERMDADMDSVGDGAELDQQDLDGMETSDTHCNVALSVLCPLCQDSFNDRKSLETHVMGVHSVNSDGLTRLLQLVDTSHWLNSTNNTKKENDDMSSERNHASNNLGGQQMRGDELECAQCSLNMKTHQELLMHAQDTQHYPCANDQYQCLLKQCPQAYNNLTTMIAHFKDTHMNIVISERHVYKYRCKQCSLAFKTQEKLNTHSLYHTMRDATKCMICNRSFRSTQSLQKHMEQAHHQQSNSPSPPPSEQDQVKSTAASSTEDFLTSPSSLVKQDDESAQAHDLMLREDQLMLHHGSLLDCSNPTSEMDEYLNTPQIAEETYNDPTRKHKCHKCKMAFTHQNFLALHYKSNQHRRNEKLNNYPMEKYLDPNRPFKCEICLESFTQKNILLVHYNSVSHLHKLKKQSENNNTPSSSPSNNPSPMDYDRKSVDSDRRSVERDRKSVDLDLEIINEQHKRKLSPENDYDSPKKRFKCDICKVAYAQGSTLDIHMRSVLHQTRACRLQEQQQQQQIQQHALQFNPSLTSSLARIVEQHQQQQQLQQSISPAPSNLSGVQDDPNIPKFNNQIYKTLLENFGFDIVKQFNELKHTGAEMSRELSDEKYFCRHCKKTFSSIFVLKSHCEEIHNDKIPLDVLEKFAEKFKNYYLEGSDVDNEILDFSAKKMSPESSHSPNSSLNGSGNALNVSTKDSQSMVNQPPTTPVSISGLSPPLREASPSSQQQQALLKSQQSARQSPEPQSQTPVAPPSQPQQTPPMLPTDLAQKFNIDPAILAQRIMEQNLATVPPNFANLPQNLQGLQNLQNLQNLQSLQNLPNMPNLPLNTLDMLSLMQFHHLMSLNFMNLAPPLIFGATGAAAAAAAIAGGNVPPVTPELPVNPTHQVQLLQQQAAAAAQATNNQKRARTRITDEQLKILRAHFDINNSPSEESIMEMSKKANLPMKVVKHWFRNTLFKERQRNKDSPYNFNNPPSTTLNLEEYERTGHAKVTPLVEQSGSTSDTSQSQQQQQQAQNQQRQHQELQAQFHQQQQQQQMNVDNRPLSQPSSTASERGADIQIKAEPNDDLSSYDPDQQSMPQHSHHQLQHPGSHMMKHDQQHDHDSSGAGGSSFQQSQHQQQMFYNNFETKSESGSSEILSRPQTPNNASYNNLGDMTGQQMDPVSLGSLSSGLAPSPAGTAGLAGVVGNLNNMGPPKKFQINKIFDKNNFETNSNSSNSSSSSGKRANRTRFTDYQIKVLQEFFENNSYPKDSDLEYLSKLLLLSPRVIVVWFQNARQKQRKIYENQPNNSFYESEDKKPNINYTCKKCNLVFQRYYELIRHQKNHCFKEENNKKSAKAQIAAAQIAQSLSSEDSNSSIDVNSANLLTSNLAAQQAAAAAAAAAAIGGQVTNIGLAQSPASTSGPGSLPAIPGLSTSPGLGLLTTSHGVFGKHTGIGSMQNTGSVSSKDGQSPQKFECDKCNLTFSRFELFKEHQLIHIMNPNLFLNQSYAENTPFGILQNMQNSLMNSGSSSSGNNSLLMGGGSQDASIDLSQPSSKKKRKYSETLPPADAAGDEIQAMMGMQVAEYDLSKKLKSEQYDFLYQYFLQNEPNDELKKQYQQQQHHQNFDIEYLARFYQMNELKKKGNYDFFYQYYLQNESKQGDSSAMLDSLTKPNIEFLLQYYQLNECKKFFQLGASPQTVHDFPLLNLTTMTSASDANTVKNTPTQQNIPNSTGLEETPTAVQMVSGSGNSTLRETFAATGRGTTPVPNTAASTNTQATTEITGSTTSSMASIINSPTHAAAVVAATILAAGGSGVMGQKTRQDQHQQPQHLTSISTTIGGSNSNAGSSPQHMHQSSNSNSCLPVGQQVSNLQKTQHQQLTNSTSNNSFQPSPPVTSQSTINDFTNSNSSFINTNIMQTPTNNTGIGGGMGGIEHVTTMEKQTNKRLRTTILPEQLNFLYECYQNESNPSRKMLEEISKKVNLKKRVVQVWYQNSRARERKGQFRQNLQIINKKCPYCGAIFKIKSALESHLQTKHPEKQPINIDQIPDVTQKPLENSVFPTLQSHGLNNLLSQTRPSSTPTSTTGNLASACTNNTSSCGPAELNQYIQANHQTYQNEGLSSSDDNATVTSTMLDPVNPSTMSKIGTPLDLSKATPKYEPSESDVSFSDSNNDQDESNDFFITASSTAANVFGNIHNNNNNSSLNNNHVKIADLVNYRHQSNNSPTTTSGNLTSTSPVRIGENNLGENRSTTNLLNDMHYDSDAASNLAGTTQHQQHQQQSRDLSMLFNNDTGTDMDRSPASPASSTQSAQKKRFRTQMSNIQVRILRTLFTDVKTPTMTDCENIGREIGLPKRVVQVWFQNARAKEKKSRNNRNFGDESFEQSGNDMTPDTAATLTDDCRICNISKVNMQEHIFSAAHILKVRHMLENGDHLIGYSGSESCDQPDATDQQLLNVKSETKLTTPPPSSGATASGCVSPNSGSIKHDQNLSVYNQLFMQNPMFVAAAATAATNNHQGSGKLFGEQDGNSHAAITAAAAMMNFNHIKQHLVAVQQQQQQQNQQQQQHNISDDNPDECDSNSAAAASAAAAAAHRLLMENNLLLQINTDQTLAQTANNSEALLQQIYNYNQMSGELIK